MTLYHRLVPILSVGDLESERIFYETIGFEVSYTGEEFPDFVGLRHGAVEFGLERQAGFEPDAAASAVTWQFGTTDVDAVQRILEKNGIAHEVEAVDPKPGWRYRLITCRTPNGYRLFIESDREAQD